MAAKLTPEEEMIQRQEAAWNQLPTTRVRIDELAAHLNDRDLGFDAEGFTATIAVFKELQAQNPIPLFAEAVARGLI